jgi:phytoene dehydrogenase-like protein
MLLGMLADRQLRLLEGGSIALVRPIENRYRDLGGQVIYRSTVEEILVDDGNALGGRLSDGSEHCSDAVISAADGRSTIYGMLGGRYVDGKIENMYKNWETIRPMVMISFGVAREFPGAGVAPCLYTGPHAVQILCDREAKPFRTTLP